MKREGKPSDKAILTSRAIDRPLRPLFPKDLFDIAEDDVPSPIDDIDSEGISKENLSDDLTFGLSGEDAVEGQKEEPLLDSEDKALIDNKKKEKEKKPRRKFKEVWAVIPVWPQVSEYG